MDINDVLGVTSGTAGLHCALTVLGAARATCSLPSFAPTSGFNFGNRIRALPPPLANLPASAAQTTCVLESAPSLAKRPPLQFSGAVR